MKTKLILILVLAFSLNSAAQINPVQNLTWSQWYEYPNNFFELHWSEPLQPHNELIGYNIYRNNELYRFQTETSLYNLYSDVYGFVSNCDIDFLAVDNQNQLYEVGFDVHVTAVYNPGEIESDYFQTAFVNLPALAINHAVQQKALLFPNPTAGPLYIGNKNLQRIVIYDMAGKIISEFGPEQQIDLSTLSKGLYVIKLFSAHEMIVDKIVIN